MQNILFPLFNEFFEQTQNSGNQMQVQFDLYIDNVIPMWGRIIKATVSDTDFNEPLFNYLLTLLYEGTLDILKKYLNQFLHIGPIRKIPEQLNENNIALQNKSWYNGLAAWDMLLLSDHTVIDVLNEYLSEEYLNTGYYVEIENYKILSFDS
ncbi:hypothetical protein D9V86_09405 [Bacteroidetes/Chlorobi group bacterium ChocPot_Mid]|nr:MAG: hypothetical protein D9V86_09405 [Bacteroidetes/Chlorobi group bacterium ChocPot_Mid]